MLALCTLNWYQEGLGRASARHQEGPVAGNRCPMAGPVLFLGSYKYMPVSAPPGRRSRRIGRKKGSAERRRLNKHGVVREPPPTPGALVRNDVKDVSPALSARGYY